MSGGETQAGMSRDNAYADGLERDENGTICKGLRQTQTAGVRKA